MANAASADHANTAGNADSADAAASATNATNAGNADKLDNLDSTDIGVAFLTGRVDNLALTGSTGSAPSGVSAAASTTTLNDQDMTLSPNRTIFMHDFTVALTQPLGCGGICGSGELGTAHLEAFAPRVRVGDGDDQLHNRRRGIDLQHSGGCDGPGRIVHARQLHQDGRRPVHRRHGRVVQLAGDLELTGRTP